MLWWFFWRVDLFMKIPILINLGRPSNIDFRVVFDSLENIDGVKKVLFAY